MSSLKDFIRTVIKRLGKVKYGYTIKDTIKIFTLQILRSSPTLIKKFRRDLLVFLMRLYSKVTVKRYGFKLALVDWESFRLFFKN